MAKWQVFQSDAGDFGVTKDGAVFRRGLKSERAGQILAKQQRAAGDAILPGVARLTITEAEPVEAKVDDFAEAVDDSLAGLAEFLNSHTSAAPADAPPPPPPVAVEVVSEVVKAPEGGPVSEAEAFSVPDFLSDVAKDIVAAVKAGQVDPQLDVIAEVEAAGANRKSVLAAVAARKVEIA